MVQKSLYQKILIFAIVFCGSVQEENSPFIALPSGRAECRLEF
jgi:hypothetical protein